MPTAIVTDVRGVIDSSLSDSEITNFLEDAEFEAGSEIEDYSNALSVDERTQLEKYLTSLFIRQFKEKGATSKSAGNRSLSYEDTWSVQELRTQVDKRDPSGNLAQIVTKDTDRYIGST